MIQLPSNTSEKKTVKAVGLLSGGLDSTLACKIIKDFGIEVHGVYFAMPWGCCDKGKAQEAADRLGIPFLVLQLDERYLEVVRKPKFGYGTAMNPCVDCRIHMFSRAGQYMQAIGADFVFTGEVLGQRPMSQMHHSLKNIESETGLAGRLLRPLSAQLLDPTIPEKEGIIDRNQLLKFSGRGRKDQIQLAKNFGITDYPNPAGGCLLTDENFARRMKDTLKYGYRNFRETVALKWGRHYRLTEHCKIIIGRDEEENKALISYAHPDDTVMQLPQNDGPTVIVKGSSGDPDLLALAAGYLQTFSKYKNAGPIEVNSWCPNNRNLITTVSAHRVPEQDLIEKKI